MNEQFQTALRRRAPRFALVLALVAMLPHALAAGRGASSAAAGAAAPEPIGVAHALDGRSMSLDEAVDAAQRRYNARVVRAEVEDRGGRRVYVLRLLSSDGRVFIVRVDAASGSMQ